MKTAAAELIKTIKQRESHVLIVSGNIYDTVVHGEHRFEDITAFLTALTAKAFPQCIKYDLFSGVSVVRGDEKAISNAMGLNANQNSGNDDALVRALRRSSIAVSSKFPTRPIEVFLCLEQLFGKNGPPPTIVIIEHADRVVNNGGDIQKLGGQQTDPALVIALTKWSRRPDLRAKGHLVVLLCRNADDLDREILDRVHETKHIHVSKPDLEIRKQFFTSSGIDERSALSLSMATSGLGLKELAKVRGMKLDQIFTYKKRILTDEYGDVLEVMDTSLGFEAIGGLEKQIAKLCQIAQYIREGRRILVPQGILLLGPPRTGKTLIVTAFAKEAGLNCVKFRDLKNELVGRSENRSTRAFSALMDLAPVVCFWDEIDQKFVRRGSFDGDSGVSKDQLRKALEFMSMPELRGRVLFVMASNRPDLIDTAMKDAGRSDLRIPFLSLDQRQLALVCQAAFKQLPDMRSSISDWIPYAEMAEGYTGADMIEVVRRAWVHTCESGRESILDIDMKWALNDYMPQKYDRSEIARMSLLAIIECSSKSLLPDNHEELAKHYFNEMIGRPPENETELYDRKSLTLPKSGMVN